MSGVSAAPIEHVDRLIEFVVRVGDRPGEARRDGEFHCRESWRRTAATGQDVHRLAGVGKCRSLTTVCQHNVAQLKLIMKVSPVVNEVNLGFHHVRAR